MDAAEQTTVTSPFDRSSTAEEVSDGVELTGKRVLVTGGAAGIGVETARVLAARGAEVTIAARQRDVAEEAAASIRAETGSAVRTAFLELTDPASIRALAEQWTGPLHLLVNNAGVMMPPDLRRTADGHELQLAVNHLGHAGLTLALHDALASADGARVVVLSSTGHLFGPVVHDDVDFRFRRYDPLAAYAQSKTAVVHLAVAATRRWSEDGITVNAVNPGAIATGLQRHVGGVLATPPELQKTVAQGAATSVFCATSPLLDGVGGRYLDDCAEAAVVDERPDDPAGLAGHVARYAVDDEAAERTWRLTLDLVGRPVR